MGDLSKLQMMILIYDGLSTEMHNIGDGILEFTIAHTCSYVLRNFDPVKKECNL